MKTLPTANRLTREYGDSFEGSEGISATKQPAQHEGHQVDIRDKMIALECSLRALAVTRTPGALTQLESSGDPQHVTFTSSHNSFLLTFAQYEHGRKLNQGTNKVSL